MEELLPELERQSEILEALLEEIRRLRADMDTARKESAENGMKKAMEHMTAALKGTPMEGIMANMMSKMKAGGSNG
jgi:hypothetical protein